MQIKVRKDRNYGNEVFYPACDKAELFALLAGTKTLTPYTIRLVRTLGYEVEEVL